MTPGERDAYAKAQALRMVSIAGPAIILICVGFYYWGRHRLSTHTTAIAPWEAGCIIVGLGVVMFANFRFINTMKGLNPKSERRR